MRGLRRGKAEGEDFEKKSLFSGTKGEWLGLIKTIVGMANTRGGNIEVSRLGSVDRREFDTARIDDKVNSRVSPRIHNIRTSFGRGPIMINVSNSLNKPHIFSGPGAYENPKPPPRQKFEFYEGQVWVRHSGRNALMTKDNFDRMFKEKLNEFLKSVNVVANQFPISAQELRVVEKNARGATPVKIVRRGKGVPVLLRRERTDPNVDYPYNARAIGQIVNKSQNFVARAFGKLGLKGDTKYAIQVKNPQGKIIAIKYSNEALKEIRKILSKEPSYDPYG